MNNSEHVQNGSYLFYANLIKPTHMWICAQQHVYEIYKEISNIKAFTIAESKKGKTLFSRGYE